MNKISQLKRALTVFFIISLVLIGLFAALYIMYPMLYAAKSGALDASLISLQLSADFTILSQAFIMPFAVTQAPDFQALYSLVGGNIPLIISVIVYVLSGLILILLVLGIVFVSNKRKPSFGFYSLAVLVSLYISYIIVVLGIKYLGAAQQDFMIGGSAVGFAILSSAVFGLGCAAFIATITTVVLGLVYAKKSMLKQVEAEEEPQSIAEAAGDPEAVQEGEEIAAPAEAIAIECEPEPVPEEANAEEPVLEEEVPEEPKVEAEPAEDKQHVEVNVNNTNPNGIDQASLATLLREVVRDIVRDEIARNNLNQPQQSQQNPNGNQTITGATFGGPLVVQYFNGGINGVAAPTPAVVENKTVEKFVEVRKDEPKAEEPAPVEEKKEEPKPASRPLFVKKEPVKEEKPAEVTPTVGPAEEPKDEKKYERLTFGERLLQSEKDVQDLYNEIKNEILSYGVKSRISSVGDTFRLHKKMYVRITVAGKSLKLYFALNPADYANSTLPIQDASDKEMYVDIPLVFKVKSPLSVRRCKELIQDVMEKDGLEQGEVGKVNWIKELKAELANSSKAKEKEDFVND